MRAAIFAKLREWYILGIAEQRPCLAPQQLGLQRGSVAAIASNRIQRPNTWLHRLMLQT